MKTNLLTLALLLMSAATFAQSLEQSFRKLLDDFKANPYAYVQANYADDFRFIAGNNGEFRTKDRMIGPNTKVEDIQATDLKFFESGDLAIVSGINTTRYAGSNGGQPRTYKDAFTYTFRKLGGNGSAARWKHVAMQHTKIDYDTPAVAKADEAAIKAVLEGHTQASMNRDAEKAVSYLANSPNVAVSYNVPGYPRGYDLVADGYRKILSSTPKSSQKLSTGDYRYRIVGNTAFVTSIETYTNPDGTANKMHKANYLEKEGSQWKMLGNFWMPEVPAK